MFTNTRKNTNDDPTRQLYQPVSPSVVEKMRRRYFEVTAGTDSREFDGGGLPVKQEIQGSFTEFYVPVAWGIKTGVSTAPRIREGFIIQRVSESCVLPLRWTRESWRVEGGIQPTVGVMGRAFPCRLTALPTVFPTLHTLYLYHETISVSFHGILRVLLLIYLVFKLFLSRHLSWMLTSWR